MKVLGLVGSPRKGGNTDLLVSAILYGAGASNDEIEKLFLYDLHISPCLDCRSCKKGTCECILKDGMKELYYKLDEADTIIFGTPLYWYGPSAKMKLLIDIDQERMTACYGQRVDAAGQVLAAADLGIIPIDLREGS